MSFKMNELPDLSQTTLGGTESVKPFLSKEERQKVTRKFNTGIDKAVRNGLPLDHYSLTVTAGIMPPLDNKPPAAYISIHLYPHGDIGKKENRGLIKLGSEQLIPVVADLLTVLMGIKIMEGMAFSDRMDLIRELMEIVNRELPNYVRELRENWRR